MIVALLTYPPQSHSRVLGKIWGKEWPCRCNVTTIGSSAEFSVSNVISLDCNASSMSTQCGQDRIALGSGPSVSHI